MEAIRLLRRGTLYVLVLFAGLSFAGCASGGIFGDRRDDDERYEDDSDYDADADRISEVRGRVERVDTGDRIIYVEPSAVYRNDLRNDDDELELHYDSSTRIEYDGRTYEPTALEPGDRIVAEVDDTGRELRVRDIEVTYDVTPGDRTADNDRDDDYDRDDDRYDDRDSDDDRYDRESDDDRSDDRDEGEVAELRGKVRWLDANRRVLEIEDASWGWGSRTNGDDVVEIHYDANTVVEFEGRRYQPTNLERGDEVQVEVRDLGSRYLADEILVVASVRD